MSHGIDRRALTFGAVSGVVSFAALFLPGSWGSSWAPGFVFGALVLAPSFAGTARRVSLLAASTVIYRGAVWFASTLYVELSGVMVPACTLAGGLGALALALATAAVTRTPVDWRATRASVLTGAISGSFLDGYLRFGDEQRWLDYTAVALCFIAWQGSYAVLHRLAPWRSA